MRIINALLIVSLLAAQQPPPQQVPADGVAKISTTFNLIIEAVTVKDKNGKVIEGLTAQDFVVTENGVPQKISFCDFQKLDIAPDTTPAPVPAAATPSAATDFKPAVKYNITPEKAGEIRYRDRRLMALYFDMSAMPPPDQMRALASARKFVKENMSGPDLMSLMVFQSGQVKILQEFTDDKAALDAAILSLIVQDENADENPGDASSADNGAAFGQDDAEFNIFTTDRQLAALQTAVKMLGGLNEQKSLVFFASGLRLNGIDNQAQMRATVNAAIRSNVKIFSVDARGLVAQPPLGDATQGSPGGQAMYSGGAALARADNFARSQDTLYTIAVDTGGKALLDNNDLSRGVVQAQQSMGSYYMIGYYTTNQTLDGKFRRIKISLKEIQGDLKYREGYYAGKEFAKFNTTDKERQLEDALMLQDPVTDLTIVMEVDFFQLNGAEYYCPVVLKIPGSELGLARKAGAEHTLIDFIGEVKDEYGTTVSNVRDKVDIKLSGQTAAELAKRPIQYDTGFTLLPGTYNIKVLARDAETGRIGTYMNKFVVPNLNKVGATPADKRVAISSVILGSQRVERKDALYTVGKNATNTQIVNPLVQDGATLLPSVTRVFSKAKDLYVYLQAYQQFSEKAEPLVAFVTFYRGQTKAFETPPLQVSEAMNNKLKTMPLRFSMSLEKLPPGRYNCQVTVLEPSGAKAAFWQAPIQLVQ